MLEGTSVGLAGGSRPTSTAGVAPPIGSAAATVATEPRREIWYRRPVSVPAALRELIAFRELVLTLAERDLRIRYKQALLGVAWALFTPVVTMIAFTLLFTRVARINTHTPGVPYVLFFYVGLLPWTFFANALTGGGTSLVGNVALLNKLYCPREVFPLAAIIDAVADTVLATVVLGILFAVTGFAPRIEVLWLPVLLVPLLAVTVGVTLAASVLVVYMRDLRLVLPLVVQVGMYVTPVIYSPATLTRSRPFTLVYSALNPLVPVLGGLRRTVLQGLAPDWLSLAIGTVSSLLVLLGGFVLFKRMETGIADFA